MTHLVKTLDGSLTLFHADTGEHYHSMHGAVTESRHVFIQAGLNHVLQAGKSSIRILEIGFGTGLNFLLSADRCLRDGVNLCYYGVEAHPLSLALIRQTGYHEYISPTLWQAYSAAYPSSLTGLTAVQTGCDLQVHPVKIEELTLTGEYDLVYFDAFSATHQPEIWEPALIARCAAALQPGGIFVTYSITGNLKRTLRALNFEVQKLPGAPGKREMLRAIRLPG